MGRLKYFGKISTKRTAGDVGPNSPTPGGAVIPETPAVVEVTFIITNGKMTVILSFELGVLKSERQPATNASANLVEWRVDASSSN